MERPKEGSRMRRETRSYEQAWASLQPSVGKPRLQMEQPASHANGPARESRAGLREDASQAFTPTRSEFISKVVPRSPSMPVQPCGSAQRIETNPRAERSEVGGKPMRRECAPLAPRGAERTVS